MVTEPHGCLDPETENVKEVAKRTENFIVTSKKP